MVTANTYFKINTDGSFAAKKGTIGNFTVTSGKITTGYATLSMRSHAFIFNGGLEIHTGTSTFSDGSDAFKVFNLSHVTSGGHTTVSTANTAKKNLDDSNTAAGKTKTDLDSSNATATQTKSGLDSTNKTASNLNTSLGEKITEGTQLQADLQTTGETAVNNLQTEANKQIQNITAAGGGIENALSNFFALRRTGKVYTTRIYKYDISTSPTGVKLNDNEGLVRKPSTNTAIGQDDYREIGVFMHFPCNFTVDNKGFNHVTALQGQPDFKKTGKVDVGEVTMSAWVGITDNPEYVDYHYSDSPNEALGLRPMGESINPDGTISPFMIHGKYGAGDIDGVPYSSAGLILANGSQKGGKPVSYTGLIAYMRKKGSMYVGTTNWDLFYKQLMMIILYATTNSRSVMAGCNSYSMQEMAAVAETGVTRVILPKAKANNYIVGSYVSVGDIGSNTNKDRYYAYMHNLAYDVKILKIEPVDDTNSAIYLDTEPFNTTLTTCISKENSNTVTGGKYMFEPETVQLGSTGTSVLLLQEILVARGFKGRNSKVLDLDREAGDNTIYALKAYQKSRNGALEVDGVCGPATWKDLIAI